MLLRPQEIPKARYRSSYGSLRRRSICTAALVRPRLCGSHALFSLPAVALARSPRFGSGFIMTLAAGYHRAAEKLLLSEPISADEAHDMRLITAVVEDEHIDSVVAAKQRGLLMLPPQAVAATNQ